MEPKRRRREPLVAKGAPGGRSNSLSTIRTEEAAIEEVERGRERLRDDGRRAVGVTGFDDVRSFRKTLTETGVGMYPAFALGLLVMVDQLQISTLTVLAPEITGALGISKSSYAAAIVLRTLVVMLAMLPVAALVQRRPRRAAVSICAAFLWTFGTAFTAFVISIWGLLFVLAVAGAAAASVLAVHVPLLVDSYPPAARVRVLSFYRGANSTGDVIGPLVIGFCTAVLMFTWRGALVMVAVVSLAAALSASGLRDPGFGRWDTERIRDVVRGPVDPGAGAAAEPAVQLGFFEIARRLLLIPTARRILTAIAVLGMFLAPFITYLSFFLQERWGMGPGGRALFFAAMPVFSIPALSIFSHRGEALFRTDPARVVRLAAFFMAAGVTSIALAIFMPVFGLMVITFGIAFAMIAVMAPSLDICLYSIVPSHMRPHLAALAGTALAGVGGTAGLILLGGIESRFGTAGAILSLAVPGIVAGLILRTASETIGVDLDRMVDDVIEEEEVRELNARDVHLPMLACRHIDFSYGQMQVLFDVKLTVDDGEMVALLGTNGAGKSSLLRVISGLGLPSRGSIRYRGLDITYLDAERRVRLGIGQVPGGRAVFGPMTVVDNLRALAYTHRGNRKAVEAGIDASFAAFPRLAERRNQLASTLSGGEQQMLGLSTAFIVRPQLLLIDELSLGLAPKVVSELLGMVRQINAGGTAVVLVEQSLNVALSVVDHAYFMEKGEIRFDGQAKELLDRPDLLRSVFLEGATKGLSKNSTAVHEAT